MEKSDKEFKQKELQKKQDDALKEYLKQFTTKKECIIEMHHLNTYQYHLNTLLWHLEEEAHQAEEENSANEQNETPDHPDSILSHVAD
jgi:hypothetical protein